MNEAEKERASEKRNSFILNRKNTINQFTPSQFLGSEIERIK